NDVRHHPRREAHGRNRRRKQRDDRRSDGGSPVRGGGVAAHDHRRVAQEREKLRKTRFSAGIDRRGAGHVRRQRPFGVAAGHDDAPAAPGCTTTYPASPPHGRAGNGTVRKRASSSSANSYPIARTSDRARRTSWM